MLELARLRFNFLPMCVLYNAVPKGHSKAEGKKKTHPHKKRLFVGFELIYNFKVFEFKGKKGESVKYFL